jgi:hypothetical protein
MSLGEDLERNIRDAWLRLRSRILNDPHELHRRLSRRRRPTLTRPPRAWCIAIRASDTRITPAHWVIFPEHAMDLDHPEHPYEPIEHEVTIQTHAIRRYCHPVTFSREDAVDVAKMLGVSQTMLLGARRRGRFYETYIRGLGGKRGRPIPLLECGRNLLDPGHRDFSRPHPIWGGAWEWLSRMIPDDFQQTILRKPVFRPAGGTVIPDCHHYKDDYRLRGYRWACPMCRKNVATIYYPLPVRTLFDSWFTDPVLQLKLCDADLPQPPPPTFACMRCHGITYFSSIKHDAWNQVITYLTAGMLYGREVQKPASFVPERKRTRIRQLNREAPVREKVLTRLRNGWSDFQIAREMGKTINAVRCAVRLICMQERVPDRHALAKKLHFAASPPPNVFQRAASRRPAVQEMLLRDCTHEQMTAALGIDHPVLQKDILAIYQQHGIKGKPHKARRELAHKLGRPFISRLEEIRGRVKQMREKGMKWAQIAREMGLTMGRMDSYRVTLQRLEKETELATKIAEPAAG